MIDEESPRARWRRRRRAEAEASSTLIDDANVAFDDGIVATRAKRFCTSNVIRVRTVVKYIENAVYTCFKVHWTTLSRRDARIIFLPLGKTPRASFPTSTQRKQLTSNGVICYCTNSASVPKLIISWTFCDMCAKSTTLPGFLLDIFRTATYLVINLAVENLIIFEIISNYKKQ